jgi:ATP synthase protein I
MNNDTSPNPKKPINVVAQIEAKTRRKIQAKRNGPSTVWLGLGMMGLVGWSVVVPSLIGVALGIWLDAHRPGKYSWTLALLMAGLSLGCFIAWHWVDKEDRAMRDEQFRHKNSSENDTENDKVIDK